MLLFSRLLVLVERDDDMKECFKYELRLIPTSLFEHGMMRKPNKLALGRAIKQDVSLVIRPDSSFHVLDGGLLLQKVKWSPKATYEIIINLYVHFVNGNYGLSLVWFLMAMTMALASKIMSTKGESGKYLLMSLLHCKATPHAAKKLSL